MSFFRYFPKIQYNNQTSRNIILKSALIKDVLEKTDAFYPYIIKDYERPDIIANKEYGNPHLDWVIYFSNSIVDPFYQWPMTDVQLKAYLEKKYNKTVYDLQNDISHYNYTGLTSDSAEEIERKSWTISTTTYGYYSPTEQSGWTPVYIYDYENELNEQRRSIKLLNKFYIPQVQQELTTIFST